MPLDKLSQLWNATEAEITRTQTRDPIAHSARGLLQELQVHQIELEMQNEILRQSQVALKESRDRYADLFEFAPVGYITLTNSGLISQINLTGATLLGEERIKLIHAHFSRFVASDDQDKWYRFFLQAMNRDCQQSCQIRGRRKDDKIFDCHLDARLIQKDSEDFELRITLTDITEQNVTGDARAQFARRIRTLTMREIDVLVLALTGMTNNHIAQQLHISQRTVENHRSHIHQKTGTVSLLELAHQASSAGVSLAEISHTQKSASCGFNNFPGVTIPGNPSLKLAAGFDTHDESCA